MHMTRRELASRILLRLISRLGREDVEDLIFGKLTFRDGALHVEQDAQHCTAIVSAAYRLADELLVRGGER